MTKLEMFNQAKDILAKNKIGVDTPLHKDLTALLEPKKGGGVVDLDVVTKRDGEGNFTHIQCSISGNFYPATADYFYEDANSKINGLSRQSRPGRLARAEWQRTVKASKEALTADFLAGEIDDKAFKAGMTKLPEAPDYKSVAKWEPKVEAPEAE